MGSCCGPEASVVVVSAALVLYFELANQNFLTNANIQTLSQFVAAPVIIACGEIMLLICRHRRAGGLARGRLAPRGQYRVAGAAIRGIPAWRVRPNRPHRDVRALAVLQTSGWANAASQARAAFEAAVARVADTGIALADRHADPVIEEVEEAIAASPAWNKEWRFTFSGRASLRDAG